MNQFSPTTWSLESNLGVLSWQQAPLLAESSSLQPFILFTISAKINLFSVFYFLCKVVGKNSLWEEESGGGVPRWASHTACWGSHIHTAAVGGLEATLRRFRVPKAGNLEAGTGDIWSPGVFKPSLLSPTQSVYFNFFTYFIFYVYTYGYMYRPSCVSVCQSVSDALEDQKASDLLRLELQIIVTSTWLGGYWELGRKLSLVED